MIPFPPLSFSAADSSQTSVNPLAGLLSGGFAFAPQNSFGGRGNAQTSRPEVTTTQTPTLTATPKTSAPAALPYADGLFGFGNGPATVAPGSDLVLPLLVGGLVLVTLIAVRR